MEHLFISTLGPAPALLIPVISENRLELSAVQTGVCVSVREHHKRKNVHYGFIAGSALY